MESLPLSPEPCRCTTADQAALCVRAGQRMSAPTRPGRLWQLCRGRAEGDLPPVSAATSDAYRRKWDGLPGADEVRRRAVRCRHRSAEPLRTDEVFSCCGKSERVDVYGCSSAARGLPETVPTRDCLACTHHEPIEGYVRQRGDPRVGLVIGSCGYPNLIELQIRAARMLCGETLPVLVSYDTGEPEKVERLRAVSIQYGTTLWRNAEKMGHAPGDVVALWKGIQFAAARGIRVLCKLSQRFVPLAPRWLQDGAQALLQSGHAISSQPCLQGRHRFAFRSEAFLVDVLQWDRPEVLAELEPSRLAAMGTWSVGRPDGMTAETFLWSLVDRFWGGKMTPWALLSDQRFDSRFPDQLWHCCDPQSRYEQVAAEYGVSLDGETVGLGGQG